MTRFRIEDSEIDIAALEARVDAAIAAKRGTRFSDEDLERLRNTPLEPRLRREDLPRGLLEELGAVRGHLPAVDPAPAAVPASAPARERPAPGSQLARPDPAFVWATSAGGLKGRLLGVFRRIASALLRSGVNLEGALSQQQDYAREMVAATERDLVSLEQRLERSFDVLKDNLDGRIDRTADWMGSHSSAVSGTLEERHERALHLAHNLVYELTNARLDLQQMQARINEMTRRVDEIETRGRTLEKLTLTEPPADS